MQVEIDIIAPRSESVRLYHVMSMRFAKYSKNLRKPLSGLSPPRLLFSIQEQTDIFIQY